MLERSNCFLSPPANLVVAIGQGTSDYGAGFEPATPDPKIRLLPGLKYPWPSPLTGIYSWGNQRQCGTGSIYSRSSRGSTPPSVPKLVYECVGYLPVVTYLASRSSPNPL